MGVSNEIDSPQRDGRGNEQRAEKAALQSDEHDVERQHEMVVKSTTKRGEGGLQHEWLRCAQVENKKQQ